MEKILTQAKNVNKTKYELNRVFVLNNPQAPRLCPALAMEIGMNESILFLQIEFWISISDHYHDGRSWTYQSLTTLKEAFPFWSKATLNRAVKSLIEKSLIVEGKYNKMKYDRTRWFAINFDAARNLKSITVVRDETHRTQNETRSTQFETCETQNGTRSTQFETTIPETTAEITSETSPDPLSAAPSGAGEGEKRSNKESSDLVTLNGSFENPSSERSLFRSVAGSGESLQMIRGLQEILGNIRATRKEEDATRKLRNRIDTGYCTADQVVGCAKWLRDNFDLVKLVPSNIESYLPTFLAKQEAGSLKRNRFETAEDRKVRTYEERDYDALADEAVLYYLERNKLTEASKPA
jgi:hypothetical protein